MLRSFCLFAGALCVSSFALAVSPSIGSVTARGETKVDNYDVRGSGTVFDGSVIETGQSVSSGADVRLAHSAEITLWRDSRGTLYRDHFMLQHGTAQLGLTNSFRVQANGITVVSTEARSGGIISINPTNAVTVQAKTGTLEILSSSGANVARVRPGHPLTFSSATSTSPAEFSATGTVNSENGRYYLSSPDTGLKYEVKGDNLQSYDGASVVASGVLESAIPTSGIAGRLLASSIQPLNSYTLTGQSTENRATIRGLSISTAVVTADTRKCPPDPLVSCCPGIPYPKCCNPLPSNQCGHSN